MSTSAWGKINQEIKGNCLQVNVVKDMVNEDMLFAYYLMKDEKAIEKIGYTAELSHVFTLSGNGIYYVTVFFKHSDTVTTQRTEAIYYYGTGVCPFYKIEEMEMTNCCNLSCANCGTPTTKCDKVFIDDSTVLATLAWTRKGQTLNYHRVGEPLLHRELAKYIRWGCEAGIKPVVSTNGLLLTEQKLKELYSAGLRHLVITLHTIESLEAFLICCDYFKQNNIMVKNFSERHSTENDIDIMYFQGKVLQFSEDEEQGKAVRNSLDGIPREYTEFLTKVPVHTWAGNVPGTQKNFSDDIIEERQKHCYFIRQRVVNVRWDGSIVGCCFDFENDNVIGNIREYPHIQADLRNYKLCKHCDANWAVSQ